ncbi:hypothetical protein AgCh_023818 [Apium graveolens]
MPKAQTMEAGKIKNKMISLRYPMLSRANYTTWAIKMKVNQQARGVWDVISPKDPKTTVVEEKEVKLAWAAIYQAIPEDMLLSLADKETAKEAWEAIKVTCQGAEHVKTAKVQTLKTEFESLVMKEIDTIDDFSMKLAGLVTNIRALGEEIAESYVVKKLLRAVSTKFLQIASTIDQFGNLDTMTLKEMVGSLKAHEKRLKGSTVIGEWFKRSNRGSDETNTQRTRGKEGVRSSRDKSKVHYFNCLAYGNYAIECRELKHDKDVKEEAHMAQIPVEEPALLLAELKENEKKVFLINEEQVKLKLNQDESWLWYSRLGHVNFKAINLMSMDNMVLGMPVIKQLKEVCTGCLMSKQYRKYFHSQLKFIAMRPLELVHGDLCGPISPSTHAGTRESRRDFEEKKAWNWCETEDAGNINTGNFVVMSTLQTQHTDVEVTIQEAHEASDNLEDEDSICQCLSISEYGSETDEPPVKVKALSEIYAATEPIELEEDELYLMGIDKPVNYSQAAKEGEWRKAMKAEIEAIDRNGTWKLTELPKGRKALI